jgi:hypothetical protein
MPRSGVALVIAFIPEGLSLATPYKYFNSTKMDKMRSVTAKFKNPEREILVPLYELETSPF